jgi:hypothetical protein
VVSSEGRRNAAHVRHHTAMCMALDVTADPLGTLVAFREAIYGTVGARRDAAAVEADSYQWRMVRTQDGRVGWMATKFLEPVLG